MLFHHAASTLVVLSFYSLFVELFTSFLPVFYPGIVSVWCTTSLLLLIYSVFISFLCLVPYRSISLLFPLRTFGVMLFVCELVFFAAIFLLSPYSLCL